jgi:hypothetical protein
MVGLRKLVIVLTLFSSTIAVAAPAPPSPAVRAACAADARRLCASVITNVAARRACMARHAAQLSSRCKAALVAARRPSKAPEPAADETPPANETAPANTEGPK